MITISHKNVYLIGSNLPPSLWELWIVKTSYQYKLDTSCYLKEKMFLPN